MASQIFLFTAGHRLLVYIRSPSFLFILMVDPIHTSGLVEASASTVYRPLWSGCGVACVIGAWPNAVLVAGGSLAVWIPQQNKTSSAGHRLWQRTWDVCRLQQQSAASSVGGAAADGEGADSEAVESGSPGRAVAGVAVGEVSVTGGASISTSGNSISLHCC